jgi:hypothetical protein
MFMQIIQGHVKDPVGAKRTLDRWLDEVRPKAEGWLGGTYGITDDNLLVACVRFTSEAAAKRNSERPEQSEWWTQMRAHFADEVQFHDCGDVALMLDGGSDTAGFVQVIQGRVRDVDRLHEIIEQSQSMIATYRGDVLGATLAIDKDGFCTQTVAFTSEAAARAAESTPMPAEAQKLLEEEMSLFDDVHYLDLHHPWFASATAS